MFKLGLSFLITAFACLVIFAVVSTPYNTMIVRNLQDIGNQSITNTTIESDFNSHMNFYPTLFGLLFVFLFLASLVSFFAGIFKKEDEGGGLGGLGGIGLGR